MHAILSGHLLELRANAGMHSPDGSCATFDAAANGCVREQGCAIVVLQRLADAEADTDRIWAVVRGTALNQDGARPGLTVPGASAQERVIKEAPRRAGFGPSEVDYVEAHGSGAEVGDPVEISAVAAAYEPGYPADRSLLTGPVKTNIGCLEAAAGVAGAIKTALAMQYRPISRHLRFATPDLQMAWERLPLHVTATATDWPGAPHRPPRAGVIGFGWSGTNAHIVVEEHGTCRSTGGGRWFEGTAGPIGLSLPAADTTPIHSRGRFSNWTTPFQEFIRSPTCLTPSKVRRSSPRASGHALARSRNPLARPGGTKAGRVRRDSSASSVPRLL